MADIFRVALLPQKSQKIFWVRGFGLGWVGLYEMTILLSPALESSHETIVPRKKGEIGGVRRN